MFTELKHSLTECEDGIYEFNNQKFVLGTEISCVAKDRGRTRKVHILILASSLESSMRITRDLSHHSKTLADGRLTVRLTPSELLELSLQSDSESLIIPSHIWTPWYGLLGSRSGYNSLEECFRGKTPLIRAMETGLSSEPEMCMRIPELRNVSTVSFSDAHSGQNLGREVTYFDERLSFPVLRSQIIKK